jgi:hypothetical protein
MNFKQKCFGLLCCVCGLIGVRSCLSLWLWICGLVQVLFLNKRKGGGKAIPLQALTGPEGSSRLRLSDFEAVGK